MFTTVILFLLALLTSIALPLMVPSVVLLLSDTVLAILTLIGVIHPAFFGSWYGSFSLTLCLRMLSRCFWGGVYELSLKRLMNSLGLLVSLIQHITTEVQSIEQPTGTISASSRLTGEQAEALTRVFPSTNSSTSFPAQEAA